MCLLSIWYADSEAPWELYGAGLNAEEIRYLADHLMEYTQDNVGIGDMTIIYAYQKYA